MWVHSVIVLVSIGLPVRNAGARVAEVVASVLAQDYARWELVISDNASNDNTEEVCRELAKSDDRIVYHRQPENVGILNNFISAIQMAHGTYYRWIGDDDRLEPNYVSQCLKAFESDERLLLVTTGISYTGPDGVTDSAIYRGTALSSEDPVDRLSEILRLLNEGHLLIDPLYGMMRRTPVAAIPRRNMVQEDQVFAAKLALAGPWGHVPQILAHRNWGYGRAAVMARFLGVPVWRSRVANLAQCAETLRAVDAVDLTPQQRRRAKAAVRAMYLKRQRIILARRTRKLARIITRR